MGDSFLQTDADRFRWTVRVACGASLAGFALYLFERGPAGLWPLAQAALAVFLSKFSIFGGIAERVPFSPWELGLIAWVLDVWVTCALIAGIASFERLPLAGRALGDAHERAGVTLRRYPGLRRLAFWGITLVVFLPLPGSGALTGTLAARLLGMSRMAAFVAVTGGAGIAALTYAGVAVFLGEQWRSLFTSPWILLACIAGLVAFVWLAWLRVKRELQRG